MRPVKFRDTMARRGLRTNKIHIAQRYKIRRSM